VVDGFNGEKKIHDVILFELFFLYNKAIQCIRTSPTKKKKRKKERSIDILVVTLILTIDENTVLFVSCLLRKHMDVETMSIYLMAFSQRLLLLLSSIYLCM